MSQTWAIFDQIGAVVPNDASNLDAKVDSMVSAAMERVADALTSMSQASLQEGANAARAAFERLDGVHPMDPTSVAFIGGRLASAADVLGFAASRAAQEGAASMARRAPYAQALSALAERPLRNVDLGARLVKSEAQICRILKELRDLELVVPQRRGREVFNVLTPIGRLAVEDASRGHLRETLDRGIAVEVAAPGTVLADMAPRVPIEGTQLFRLATPA